MTPLLEVRDLTIRFDMAGGTTFNFVDSFQSALE